MRELIRFLLVGLMAGWIASIMVRERRRFGPRGARLFSYMIVGMLGAVIGGVLFEQLGWTGGAGFVGSVITATVGAGVLLVVLRLLRNA